jgi:DNA-binding CsgD family transcriptional regulator
VRDFGRAAQWCEKLREFSLRFNYRSMLAYCRTHYAAVLIWRGAWAEAEAELTTATRELSATRLGLAAEGVVRLGDLRRRQGQPDEAARLFAEVPGHPASTLGWAALAFDAGDVHAAADLVERFMRQLPRENLMERVDGLDLGLRVHCALGQHDQAREALALLTAAAETAGTPWLRGTVATGRGHIAAVTGDLDAARRCFEDAVDLFQRCGVPFEAARARIELARTLAALGRPEVAAAEARQALDVLLGLGAAPDAVRAQDLLKDLGVAGAPAGPLPSGLTRREAEVLSLLARGQSNQEIAGALFLSVRTVERHISSIYAKLDLAGPTARAAASAFAVRHRLAPAITP